ncbi:DNA repair protein XRCC4-like [Pecten maximus]|uniref:DNA repair protein XRCC4-like n=1 Tax=Pecten maximus TaxID=6579 RepID=UPI0014580A66|nr:DNA repair protein XRCC4-like [Pecten maximus]
MERKAFIKLDLNEDKQVFLLTTLTDEDQPDCKFKLTLCDGLKVWRGQVTQINFGDPTKKSNKYLQEYQRQTVEAFTGEATNDNEYRFTLKNLANSVELSWKRNVPSKEIAFLLGTTSLKPCNEEKSKDVVAQIFQYCIDQTVEFKDQIRTLNIENENLAQERVNALKRLEKCVVAKEDMEKDLYSKFVAVLNAKKEKIQRLKDQIENGAPTPVVSDSEEEPSASTSGTRKTTSNATAARKRKASDESEGDTSDENLTPSPSRRTRKKGAKPSKTEDDDGLVLDESIDTVKSKVVRRPRRPPGGNKKQTPSKPVLPRVNSDSSNSSGT